MSAAIIPFVYAVDSLVAPVRVIERAGAPWFVAADVAVILGYRDADKATRLLEDDEKGTQTVGTPGGAQALTVINESGLYALILRSRKPAAKRFRKWVTGEVLPSLRRTGRYDTGEADRRAFLGALHAHQLRVLAAILGLAREGETRISGLRELAEIAGLSQANTRRCVELLDALGFIVVDEAKR